MPFPDNNLHIPHAAGPSCCTAIGPGDAAAPSHLGIDCLQELVPVIQDHFLAGGEGKRAFCAVIIRIGAKKTGTGKPVPVETSDHSLIIIRDWHIRCRWRSLCPA